MKNLYLLILALIYVCSEGCSPSSKQRTEMVRCSNNLKIAFLDFEIAMSTNESLSTNSIKRILASFSRCPVNGTPYEMNPNTQKWIASSNYASEIAIFCPDVHYRTLFQRRYAAITFDGRLVKLTNAPNWKTGSP